MTLSIPPRHGDVIRFRALLADFRRRNTVPRGETDRFQFLCDQMFTVFGTSGIWTAHREKERVLLADDNLDTGNPCWHPPDDFLKNMLKLLSDPENLRRYYGGFAREDLRDAVRSFLQHYGLLTPDHAVDVVAGAGTVHLYDLLCRHLVRRNNDVMLSAHPFYGFFLPHAERSGGQTRLLRPDDGYRCSPQLLATSIDAVNDKLHVGWATTVVHRTVLFLTDVAAHFGTNHERSWTRAVVDAIGHLSAWPRHPDRCDEVFIAILEPFFAELGLSWSSLARVGRLPTVPRVVAWIQINPTQGGDVYRQDHVTALSTVLHSNSVAPIEDFAYHSVRVSLDKLGTFFRTGLATYQLLGLSKPFGLANCRVGLLVTDTDSGYQLGRLVENSAGWMSTFYQIALRDLLSSVEIHEYLRWNSDDSPDSYAKRCDLALAALRGHSHGPAASEDVVAQVRRLTYEVAGEFLPSTDTATGGCDSQTSSLVEEFLQDGLTAWLSIPRMPDAGFFIMADCRPLLRSALGRALDLRCAFDAFALLTYFVGVRTIPEEAMTVAPMAADTRLLRLSFSVPTRMWVRACFATFVRLRQLTQFCTEGRI